MQQQLLPRAAAIERAAAILGGLGPLARRLNVPERQLAYWVRDMGTPPDTVFFDVLDVIIESVA